MWQTAGRPRTQPIGLDLAVPDRSTLSCRAETLKVPRPKARSAPLHLLLDSTGLRLCEPGEWLEEEQDSKRRLAWRVLHLATDAKPRHIVASVLTDREADDGSRVNPLLDQVDGWWPRSPATAPLTRTTA